MAWLPSWQAYSQISPAVTPREAWSVVIGAEAVHGRVNESGSSTVNVYSIVCGPVRVKRSTSRRLAARGESPSSSVEEDR